VLRGTREEEKENPPGKTTHQGVSEATNRIAAVRDQEKGVIPIA